MGPEVYPVEKQIKLDVSKESSLAIHQIMSPNVYIDDGKCVSNDDCLNYPYELCGIDVKDECGHKKVFP